MQMIESCVSRRRPIHWKLFDQVECVANHDFRLLVHIDFTTPPSSEPLSVRHYILVKGPITHQGGITGTRRDYVYSYISLLLVGC